MKEVRIGVLGTGNIGRVHIDRLQKLPGVTIAAVADEAQASVDAAANDFGIAEAFSDYRKLLKIDDIDAVMVCTPNVFHHQMVVDSLRAGRHVFCEKPMAMNATQAAEMTSLAKQTGRMLYMGFCNRFRGKSKALKAFIDSGKLGEIYHCLVMVTRRRGVPAIGSWFTQKSLSGGGALIDIGVHMLDLNLWMMGHPKPVSVSGASYAKFGSRSDYVYLNMWGKPVPGGTFDVDDYATAFVRFENGCTLTLECCWAANIPQVNWQSHLMGDKGGAKYDLVDNLEIYTEEAGYIADIKPYYNEVDMYQAQMEHYIETLRGDVEPSCTGEHGLTVQKIIDGIYESAAKGKEVVIN